MTPAKRHIDRITELTQGKVLTDAPLSRYTTFRIGGPADVLVEPRSPVALGELRAYLTEWEVPHLIVGAGSNILFRDGGYRGVVIRTNELDGLIVVEESNTIRIVAQAGTPLPFVIRVAGKAGGLGLEELWGIPGSLGGSVAVNAGSARVALCDFVHEARVMDPTGTECTLTHSQLNCSYRSLALPEGSMITSVDLRLERGPALSIQAGLDAARARKAAQPHNAPSAGCVFKNPRSGLSAGKLIDEAGLKGFGVGGAQVSQSHGNFIINKGDATATDVLAVITRIRERLQQDGISLALEIQILGEDRS